MIESLFHFLYKNEKISKRIRLMAINNLIDLYFERIRRKKDREKSYLLLEHVIREKMKIENIDEND